MKESSQRASVIGRSAAEYGALVDESVRKPLFVELLSSDPAAALELARNHGWWQYLESAVKESSDSGAVVQLLNAAAHEIATYPGLVETLVSAAPSVVARKLALGIFGSSSGEVWQKLSPGADQLDNDLVVELLGYLLRIDAISANEAIWRLERVTTNSPPRHESLGDHWHATAFSSLLSEITRRVPVPDARRFLLRHLPLSAVVDQSGSVPGRGHEAFARTEQTIIGVARDLVSRMSAVSAVGWASRVLSEALRDDVRRFGGRYDGREIRGTGYSQIGNHFSYQDNLWLIEVLVPAYQRAIRERGTRSIYHILQCETFTLRHPTFRTRALLLALDDASLGTIRPLVTPLAAIHDGIPSIAAVVIERATADPPLAASILQDFGPDRRFWTLTPGTSKLIHILIASPNHRSIGVRAARELVNNPNIASIEMAAGFFDQLDWAERDPKLALELLERALAAGFRITLFDERWVSGIIRAAASEPSTRDAVWSNRAFVRLLPNVLEPTSDVFREKAVWLYKHATRDGKMELLRKAENADLDVATDLAHLGLDHRHPGPRDSVVLQYDDKNSGQIYGVRVWAYLLAYKLIGQLRMVDADSLIAHVYRRASTETTSFVSHFALIAIQGCYNRAIKDSEYSRAALALDQAEELLGRVKPTSEMLHQVAGLLDAFWVKLSDLQREKYWATYGATDVALSRALRSLIDRDDEVAFRHLRHVASLDQKRANWIGWALWRALTDITESRDSLSTLVVDLIDELIEVVDSDGLMSLSRLALDGGIPEPSKMYGVLLHVARKAVKSAHHVYFPEELPAPPSYAEPEAVLALAAELRDPSVDQYSIIGFVSNLLSGITSPKYADRVKAAFQPLLRWPQASQAFANWRAAVAS